MLIKELKVKWEQKSMLAVFDFTLPETEENKSEVLIMDELTNFCKLKSSFQGETSTTGYKHWQGRISVNNTFKHSKCYIWDLIALCAKISIFKGIHWSITNKLCTTGPRYYEYLTKKFTRTSGPFLLSRDSNRAKELDELVHKPEYIPHNFRIIACLYSFQQSILDLSKKWISNYYAKLTACLAFRGKCNFVANPAGGAGKGYLKDIAFYHYGALELPVLEDPLKLIQTAENMFRGLNVRKSRIIFFDIPRTIPREKLRTLYYTIEILLGQKLYDLRNKFKGYYTYDLPVIWVFANEYPDITKLSYDRWRVFEINDKKELKCLSNKQCKQRFRLQEQKHSNMFDHLDGTMTIL